MKLYNTLSGQKEEFRPQGEPVRIYVCGVTPYDECHVGHAMSYIFFDVLRRYLEFRGYKLRYVQNFTDIDDKIINRAREKGVSARELADKYIARYFEDMDALNIQQADVYPYATREIPEIIRLIEGLVEKGPAYVSGGDVYFRVRSFASYGKLSRRTLDGMLAGARVEPGEGKEFPLDFALWKGAKPGEPSWPSPWGEGRPGWHIECSAMSLKYLGETLDIHGGGQDLIFPHHENEIAQSEAFTGKPFVRYFVHNALLQLGREKMSKSLGNLVPVREALEKWGADALRLFVLSSHYRMPLTFSGEAVEAAKKGAERLGLALSPLKEGKGQPALDPEPFRQRFVEAMDDDLNTPQALAALFDLAREVNTADQGGMQASSARQALRELCDVVGLRAESYRHDPRTFISLSATSGSPGSTLKISGTGFPANEPVSSLTMRGIPVLPSPAPTTDRNGNLIAEVIVPALPAGPVPVAVTVAGVTGVAAFTVTTAAITPSVYLAGIAGKYTRVEGFDAASRTWKVFDPANPWISNLGGLEVGQEYRIHMTEDATLIQEGNEYILKKGWNVIRWLPPETAAKALQLLSAVSEETERKGVWFPPLEESAEGDIAPIMRNLVRLRDRLRQAKEYALADKIRDRLAELGLVLEDTPQGTVWRYRK